MQMLIFYFIFFKSQAMTFAISIYHVDQIYFPISSLLQVRKHRPQKEQILINFDEAIM